MFTKKVRRNFRQRRDDSSGEDDNGKVSDNVKEADAQVPSLKQVNVRRGIACSSKSNSTPPHRGACTESSPEHLEEAETFKSQTLENKQTTKNQTLSFLDEKEGKSQAIHLAILLC